jgi:hypothetical protein
MPLAEDEPITVGPGWLVRVDAQDLGIEHRQQLNHRKV